ncbi:MAG: helix-turn-helix domain-containing protein [Ilumatobacteraceae bacterium]
MDRDSLTELRTDLNLKQVASRLGVHYMTAYRYVRQGHLEADRDGTEWRISESAVEAFAARRASPPPIRVTPSNDVDWASRLAVPLLVGDETTGWAIIEKALAAGHDPEFCYLDMIASAIATIDHQRLLGEVDAAQQPLATAVAYRLTARLGSRFRRSGRSRGSVIFGAPSGERHHLPIAIVADLVRMAGFDVLELGADSTPQAFAAAITHAPRLVAVCIGITGVDHLDAARRTIAAVRANCPQIPIVVGGQAVLNPQVAEILDATAWAADGRAAVAMIERFARR